MTLPELGRAVIFDLMLRHGGAARLDDMEVLSSAQRMAVKNGLSQWAAQILVVELLLEGGYDYVDDSYFVPKGSGTLVKESAD